MTTNSPSQQKCPENRGGGTHHLTPKHTKAGMIMSCLTCKKTEEEIRNGS